MRLDAFSASASYYRCIRQDPLSVFGWLSIIQMPLTASRFEASVVGTGIMSRPISYRRPDIEPRDGRFLATVPFALRTDFVVLETSIIRCIVALPMKWDEEGSWPKEISKTISDHNHKAQGQLPNHDWVDDWPSLWSYAGSIPSWMILACRRGLH